MRSPVPLLERVAGKEGIGRIPVRVAGMWIWVVSDPDLLEVVHEDRETFDKGGKIYEIICQSLGISIFTTNDREVWENARRPLVPFLTPNAVRERQPLELEAFRNDMDAWDTTQPVPLFQQFRKHSVRTILTLLLGKTNDDEVERFNELAGPVFEGMATTLFLPHWLPAAKRYQQAIARLDEPIYAIIREYRMGTRQGGALQEYTNMLDKEMRDHFAAQFMAAQDSTAAALSWACIRLAEDPNLLKELCEEAQQVTGGEPPTPQHLRQLGTKQKGGARSKLAIFVEDVLSAHPPFPAYFRNVATTTELGGKTLEKGSLVVILPPPGKAFGQGVRKCTGEHMARATIMGILITMMKRFERWERPPKRFNRPGRLFADNDKNERVIYAMTQRPARDGQVAFG